MTDAEIRLREAGFEHAHLWVLDGNVRAAAFYERHGWHEDGVAKDDDELIAGPHPQTLRERRRVRRLE
jgi:RimJ/RimL family protein N-acetyltransferase